MSGQAVVTLTTQANELWKQLKRRGIMVIDNGDVQMRNGETLSIQEMEVLVQIALQRWGGATYANYFQIVETVDGY